jgi:hypothetical protein
MTYRRDEAHQATCDTDFVIMPLHPVSLDQWPKGIVPANHRLLAVARMGHEGD